MERRFFNQSQPQTLQVAVFLLYANVVFSLLFRTGNEGSFGAAVNAFLRQDDPGTARLIGNLLAVAFVIGSAACGYLIANEKRIGWRLGVVVAAAPIVAVVILLTIAYPQRISVTDIRPIGFLFDVALLALLLHTQSRAYEKVWFK